MGKGSTVTHLKKRKVCDIAKNSSVNKKIGKIIHHLLKNNGFTIKGAKKALKSKKNDFQKNIFLKERLLEFKKFLVSLRESL